MRIITEKPIIQYSSFNDDFIPFDGRTDLEELSGFDGEIIYCSADGENFYNAKGEKLKGFFKKVGGGIVKGGKAVGKALKKVGHAIVGASKKVAKGVKTAGGKVKAGAKKLIHHKKKEKTASADKDKTGSADKGKPGTASTSNENKANTQAEDVFTKPLEKATPQTPPEKVVEVNGQKYSTEGVEKGKEVVVTTNEAGQEIAGVEYAPSEVVAVTGKDGNIEYHTPEAVSGSKMTTTTKVLIGVGIALVLGTIVYFAMRNKKKNG